MDRYRILAIDDDPDARNLLRLTLQETYEGVLADGGQDALQKLPRVEPDIVVADIMMPELNGYDFVQRLRATPEFRETLVIFLTALHGRMEIERAYQSGGDLVLTKPLSPPHLLQIMNCMIRERRLMPKRKRFSMKDLKTIGARNGSVSGETAPMLSETELRNGSDAPRLSCNEPESIRVLVAEGNPRIRRLLWDHLKHDYEVIIASEGAGAWELAKRWKPDIFVLDQGLPGISGEGLARRLLANSEFASAPVIMITAEAKPHFPRRFPSDRLAGIVQRPVNPAVVGVALDRAIRGESFRLRLERPPFRQYRCPFSEPSRAVSAGAEVQWQG